MSTPNFCIRRKRLRRVRNAHRLRVPPVSAARRGGVMQQEEHASARVPTRTRLPPSGQRREKTHHQRKGILVLADLRHRDRRRAAQHLLAGADHEGAVDAEARDAVVVVQRLLLDRRPEASAKSAYSHVDTINTCAFDVTARLSVVWSLYDDEQRHAASLSPCFLHLAEFFGNDVQGTSRAWKPQRAVKRDIRTGRHFSAVGSVTGSAPSDPAAIGLQEAIAVRVALWVKGGRESWIRRRDSHLRHT